MAAIELYRWTVGATVTRETSSGRTVTSGSPATPDGGTYAPVTIGRTAIVLGSDGAGPKLTVTVPRDHAIATQFRALPPDAVSLQVYQLRSGSYVRIWSGRVVDVKWSGSTAQLFGEPPESLASQRGLRIAFQRTCRHRFEDHRCLAQAGVSGSHTELVAFEQNYTVASVSGVEVTLTGLGTFVTARVSDYAANGAAWYVGGTLTFEGNRRQVVAHSGDVVTLNAPLPDLEASDTVALRVGCAHTLAECHAKFRNAANFGGFVFGPEKNPFEGLLE